MTLRLSAADWSRLEKEAREAGVGPTTLLRVWMLERLRGPRGLSDDALGAIEASVRRAFREGFLLQSASHELDSSEPGTAFYGNMVLN